MGSEMLLNESDIIINEISSCFEDTSLYLKWRQRTHCTGKSCYLMLGIAGSTVFTVDGIKYSVGKSDIMFFPENTVYNGECLEVPARIIVIAFSGRNVSGFDKPFLLSPKRWDGYEQIFFDMKEKYFIGEYGCKTELKAMLYTLISKIIKERMLGESDERSYRRIKESIIYIHENYYDTEMSIARAAELSGMSEVHFRRLFRDVFKKSPLKYITEIRIKKAKELLAHTQYQVGEISGMVGIYDEVYFSKFFKRHTGKTPNEYRKHYRGMIE